MFSVRVPEYAGTQEGTLHFHYLLNENGGLLHMAGSLDEHVQSLSRAVDRSDEDDRRLRSFVEGFVDRHSIVPRPPSWPMPSRSRLPKLAPERPSLGLLAIRVAHPIGTAMKVVRTLRGSRKRERQPTAHGERFLPQAGCHSGALLPMGACEEVCAPIHRAPRAPQMMTGDIPTQEMTAIRRSCSGWPTARSTSSLVRG